MEKVIFDTNFIRNTEPKQFLGGRSELEKFAKVAELVFPDIVIEEIKNQKRRSLEKNKTSFLGNPFHWLRKLDLFEGPVGRFNVETREAVKIFQKQAGLKPDGVAGPQTLALLFHWARSAGRGRDDAKTIEEKGNNAGK